MMTLFDKHEPEAMLPPITLGEKITPRDYQQEALDGFFRSYAEGSRHMMARLATGCGKTLTAALIAERWLAKGPRHRVMVMAYESILVDQFADEMREFLPHIQTRVEMANEAIVHIPQIVVASRQSLYIDKSGRSRLFKFPNQDLNWLVVCDEAHGYKASMASFTHIVQWFEENPANVFLGLTATPQRGDGVSLKRLFGTVVAELRLSKAINDGWLVPFKQKFIRVDGVDFKALKTVAGDWTSAELDNILSEQEQLTSMAIPLLEQTEGKRTLVFTPGVACAQKLAQVINAEIKIRGLPHGKAESMHGGTPRDERQAIIEQHQSGQIQYLVVCGLCLSKGTMVLTDRGEVPIEQVTTEMKLWDGIEYVSHDGVIAKGVRPVITYAGLTATEDHRVWTDRGWEQLATCKKQRINIRISAIGGKAVRESCGYYRGGDQNWQVPSNRIGSSVQYVWETICKGLQRIKARQIWMQALLKKQRSSELAFGQMSAPKIAVHKRVQQALHGLWRKRNRVSLFIPGGGRPVDHEQSWPTRRFVFGPNRQQRSLRTGELALVHMDGASEQQTEEAKGISEEEVFDILNAGPRNRFTANGLIVSNCRAGYNDPGISAVAVFRPTKSKVLAEQMKGRGVRTLRGTLTPGMTKEERLEAIANSDKPHCLIIDMVGVSGMSEVASTAHLLAEGEDDEIVARANQNMIDAGDDADDSETVEQAIAKAKAEIEEEREAARLAAEEAKRRQREEFERRAKLAADVRYEAREVNDFRGFGAAHNTSANAPTAKQIAALKRHGWSAQDAGQLTKRQASAILGRLFGDKDAVSNRPVTDGPPTETQTRLLQRRGLPIPKTYGEAANIITSLDWKPLNN